MWDIFLPLHLLAFWMMGSLKKFDKSWTSFQKVGFHLILFVCIKFASFRKKVIFWRLRLSLGHFGQQVPESPVSQLQNGVSKSSLPPFIVDLLTFKVYTRSNSFGNSSGVISLSIAQRPFPPIKCVPFLFWNISHVICNQIFQIEVPALPLILSALFVLLCK